MKLSLATKIFVAFAFTLSTFAAIAFFSVNEFHALGQDLRNINDGHLVLARLGSQLETHQQNRFRDLRQVLDEPDRESREVVLRIATSYFPGVIRSRVAAVREVCLRQITRIDAAGDSGVSGKRAFYITIGERIDTIAARHATVDDLTEALLTRVRTDTSADDLAASITGLESQLRGELYQLNKDIDDETDQAVRRAERDERAAIWRVIAMTSGALVLGLVLTLLAARALAPIRKLVVFARAISRGDYEHQPDMRGDDELAALAEELTLMAKNRKEREADLDRQQDELERAYHRVADLKRYHESVVQSLNTAVIVTDRELNVTSTNRAVEVHLGLTPAHVRGRRLPELPIGADLDALCGPLTGRVERAEPAHLTALAVGDKLFDVSLTPFEDEQGAVLGLVLAAEEVTEAVQTKEALIRSERLAAIGRMSAHVTHEIRNPLSSIGLNAEMLESLIAEEGPSASTDEAHTICRAITREVDRLTAITDEYLRFARLPRPELRPAAPAPMLTSIANFVARDCAAANVTIAVETPDDPVELHADPDQIRQALLNLVRNAKESMPEGGHIDLAVETTQHDVTLIVRDTGGGIVKEDLERIFDPFYSTKQTGTGLGLALVQQIVAEHGGALAVDSSADRGTEFRIVMPRTRVETDAEAPRTPRRAADG